MSRNSSSLQEIASLNAVTDQRENSSADGDLVGHPRSTPSGQLQRTICELLSREEYPQWDKLVDRSPHGTVFHYAWWLEAAFNNFKLLVARDEKGRIVAGLPLPLRRRAGLRLVHASSLTPYLGPIFDLSVADSASDQLYMMRKYGEILGNHIGAYDSFRCVAGAQAPDLQGLIWAGFRVSVASYTFRFRAGLSPDDIRSLMSRTHLQKLRKARAVNLSLVRDEDINELTALTVKTFERQRLPVPYDFDRIRHLWAVASPRGKAHLYVVKLQDGTPVSALFTVNDQKTTYQIVSGVDTAFRDVPGAYFALWHAIQDAMNAGRDFDFEGSGLHGVESFYRRWGGTALPVWRIEKSNSWRGALLQFVLHRGHQASQSKELRARTPSPTKYSLFGGPRL